jgi:hypothetical protein
MCLIKVHLLVKRIFDPIKMYGRIKIILLVLFLSVNDVTKYTTTSRMLNSSFCVTFTPKFNIGIVAYFDSSSQDLSIMVVTSKT